MCEGVRKDCTLVKRTWRIFSLAGAPALPKTVMTFRWQREADTQGLANGINCQVHGNGSGEAS
jgi:hypothetical protein